MIVPSPGGQDEVCLEESHQGEVEDQVWLLHAEELCVLTIIGNSGALTECIRVTHQSGYY